MPKATFPVLGTERLTLRQMKLSDAPALVALLSDGEVARWLSFGTDKKISRTYMTLIELRMILVRRRGFLAGRRVNWLICDKSTGETMGTICLSPIDRARNSAEAGFWLGRAFWGRGYMTEAFAAVLDYAFGTLGLNRVSAGHFAGNIASGRVQQKCGLLYEGTHRQVFLKDGQYIDEIMYAITKEDWENRKK